MAEHHEGITEKCKIGSGYNGEANLTENERAYEINGEFRQYVDRYCKRTGITKEKALRHKIVDYVRQQYGEGKDV